ncbi:MAG: hypothetical protein IRZ32_10840, partial [Solirubrobacteraceae bacterium]|nr:hypothetical protein [Solirubrobacteraceae bacterium]
SSHPRPAPPPPGGAAQPTPPTVATAPATTPATTPTTPQKLDATAQAAVLQTCVGGRPADTFEWFQPTVDYAVSMGGTGFTVTLKGKPVTLIVFPYVEAAQYGYEDIQERLIQLQQKRPTDYAIVAATAAQPVGNVLEIASQGMLDPEAEAKVQRCIQEATTPR